MRHCVVKALEENWIRRPIVLIAWSVPLMLLAGLIPGWLTVDSNDRRRHWCLLAPVGFAVAFFLSHARIVVLVDVPYERFIYAMHLLLPPALLGILFELCRPRQKQPVAD